MTGVQYVGTCSAHARGCASVAAAAAAAAAAAFDAKTHQDTASGTAAELDRPERR